MKGIHRRVWGLLLAFVLTVGGWFPGGPAIRAAEPPVPSEPPIGGGAVSSLLIVKTTAGDDFAAALRSDGSVWTWGENSYGQLGIYGNLNDIKNYSPQKAIFYDTSIQDISSGQRHTVALEDDGSVWVWGDNSSGQLGTGDAINRSVPVGDVRYADGTVLSSNFSSVAAGGRFTAALRNDGTVWMWGEGARGQLGHGTAELSRKAVQASIPNPVVAIAAGKNHMLALDDNGYVWAWGDNTFGQAGQDHTALTKVTVPMQVTLEGGAPLRGVASIAASSQSDSSFAILNNGGVFAWGANRSGQLGIGVREGTDIEPAIVDIPDVVAPLQGIKSIALGEQFGFAVNEEGRLLSWGRSQNGLFGSVAQDDLKLPPSPEERMESLAVSRVAAGNSFVHVLGADGVLRGWGSNAYGSLGVGTSDENILVPTTVEGLLWYDSIYVSGVVSGTDGLQLTKLPNYEARLYAQKADESWEIQPVDYNRHDDYFSMVFSSLLPEEVYKLVVTAPGYQPSEQVFRLQGGQYTNTLSINLLPEAVSDWLVMEVENTSLTDDISIVESHRTGAGYRTTSILYPVIQQNLTTKTIRLPRPENSVPGLAHHYLIHGRDYESGQGQDYVLYRSLTAADLSLPKHLFRVDEASMAPLEVDLQGLNSDPQVLGTIALSLEDEAGVAILAADIFPGTLLPSGNYNFRLEAWGYDEERFYLLKSDFSYSPNSHRLSFVQEDLARVTLDMTNLSGVRITPEFLHRQAPGHVDQDRYFSEVPMNLDQTIYMSKHPYTKLATEYVAYLSDPREGEGFFPWMSFIYRHPNPVLEGDRLLQADTNLRTSIGLNDNEVYGAGAAIPFDLLHVLDGQGNTVSAITYFDYEQLNLEQLRGTLTFSGPQIYSVPVGIGQGGFFTLPEQPGTYTVSYAVYDSLIPVAPSMKTIRIEESPSIDVYRISGQILLQNVAAESVSIRLQGNGFVGDAVYGAAVGTSVYGQYHLYAADASGTRLLYYFDVPAGSYQVTARSGEITSSAYANTDSPTGPELALIKPAQPGRVPTALHWTGGALSLSPGEELKPSVTAYYSDGSFEDVSDRDLEIAIADTSVARLISGGNIQGLRSGTTSLVVVYTEPGQAPVQSMGSLSVVYNPVWLKEHLERLYPGAFGIQELVHFLQRTDQVLDVNGNGSFDRDDVSELLRLIGPRNMPPLV
ncbi:RCC1 domain-containing protein [Paenibacillus puerhi]|uniref:RCC1 domain-containing protein n=1 Tax=Paenibacillus puerhi TaxID=2692622 RepID=UPI00135CA62F|nr:hypothetical protein [Paenibacillus puerhi]